MDDQLREAVEARMVEKKFSDVITMLDGVIQKDFLDAEALLLRGKAHAALHDHDKAIDDFEKAIGAAPDFGSPYLNKGWAYFHKSDFHQALKDFDEAARLNPDWEQPFFGRGLIYSKLNNYDEAIKNFSRSIANDPSYALALAERALVYEQTQRMEEAIADLVLASQIFGNMGRDLLAQSTLAKAQEWMAQIATDGR